MKTMTKFFPTVTAIAFLVLTTLISCEKSAERNAEGANEKVEAAEDNMQKAEQDKKAAEAEYKNYQLETEKRINQYNVAIAELKEKANRSNSKMKAEYNTKIAELEEKNNNLKARFKAFKYDNKEKWQEFKREFEHDMDDLGKSLKDFTVDNTK
jgi:hypothetical protein